jgi:hypothetical protein
MPDTVSDRPRTASGPSIALAFAPLGAAFFLLMIYLSAASGGSALDQQQAAAVALYGIPSMVVLSFIGGARAAAQSGKLRWFLVPLGGVAFAFLAFFIFILTLVSH